MIVYVFPLINTQLVYLAEKHQEQSVPLDFSAELLPLRISVDVHHLFQSVVDRQHSIYAHSVKSQLFQQNFVYLSSPQVFLCYSKLHLCDIHISSSFVPMQVLDLVYWLFQCTVVSPGQHLRLMIGQVTGLESASDLILMNLPSTVHR